MTEYYNAWKEMFENSQKMMNDWMGAFANPGEVKDNASMNQGFNPYNYQDIVNMQQNWYKDWKNMYQGMNNMYKGMNTANSMFNGPYQVWVDMMDSYNPFQMGQSMNPFNRDVFEKMQNSQKLYLSLYEQWKQFNDQILKPGSDSYNKNIHEMAEQFNKVFTSNFIPLMPKELQGLALNTQSYFNTYFKSMENFLGPWAYAYQNIADITMQSMFDDPMKFSETLKQWKAAYDQTFGILVKSPVVGSSRELLEQNNKAVNAMIEMLVAVSEYMTRTASIGYKYSKEYFENYATSIQEGEQPKTFKEFYDMWSKYVEDAIETYFYTDEFAEVLAKTAETSMIFKVEYDKVIEKSLSNLPIVTISQVDGVYEKVYNLRRELREVKKELEDLKSSLNTKTEQK